MHLHYEASSLANKDTLFFLSLAIDLTGSDFTTENNLIFSGRFCQTSYWDLLKFTSSSCGGDLTS